MIVPNVREVISAEHERRLSAAEVDAYLSTPVSDAERENVLSLVAWFLRRYPTPADRLAYVRRACHRWTEFG